MTDRSRRARNCRGEKEWLQSLTFTAATSTVTKSITSLGWGCPVSRYYFNLVGPKGVIIDPEGAEMSENDLEQAIPRILEEARSEEPELFDVGGGWSLEVVDVDGRRVAIFPL
jgi:hypothetical protein